MEHRRRVPRQPAGWFAKCVLEEDSEQPWSQCQVIDISTIGAGLEVHGMANRFLIGKVIVVEVTAPTDADFSARFIGEIKNAGEVPHGGIRIGIEFVGLSRTERSILDVFEQMQVSW
jgi:hypothetical protein